MGKSNRHIAVIDDGCVKVSCSVLGPIANNVYVIDDGSGVIIVDPSCRPDDIMAMVGDRHVDAIFVTHNHSDHIGALADIVARTKAPVVASKIDAPLIEAGQDGILSAVAPCRVDRKVGDGDIVQVGKTAWKVLLTPGHTPGGICFFLDSAASPRKAGKPVLFSGDTLFCGSIGRTDFEGGDMKAMRKSLHYLAFLPDPTIVFPGHDTLTTIRAERKRVFAYYA